MALEIGKKVAKWTMILTSLDYLILVATFIFSLFVVANLRPENYGIFSIASATYLIFASLLQTFFASPFIRSVSRYLGKNDLTSISYLYGLITVTTLMISAVIALIHLEISPFIAVYVLNYPEVTEYMELLSLNIITLTITALFRGFLLSLKSYTKLAISRLADGLLYIVGIYALVLVYDWTVLAIVLGTNAYLLISCIITAFLGAIEAKKKGIKFKVSLNKVNLLKENLELGKYFIVGNGLAYIFIRWDLLVVSIVVHDSLLIGYYSFAKSLLNRVRIIFTKINSLLYPIFSEQDAISNFKVMKKLLNAGNIIALTISVILAFFIMGFAEEGIILVSLFIEKMLAYQNAATILSIFGLLLIPYSLDVAIIPYFNGIGEVDKLVKANAILLGSSLILLPLLSTYFGIIGATLAYISSQYLRMLYWVNLTYKRIGINLKKYIKIIASALSGIVSTTIIYHLLELLLMRFRPMETTISLLIIPLFLIHSLITYILLVRTKVITKREIDILQRGFSKNKLAKKVIDLAEKIGGLKND